MKIAILGLTQSGKKTFFSLLAARAGNFPAHMKEGESFESTVPTHDPRVDALALLLKPRKVKYAENTIVLCPDIITGSDKKAWVEPARRCDLLCFFIRDFASDQVCHPAGSVDAKRDRSTLESEALLMDLELIEKRLERLSKEKRTSQSSIKDMEAHVLGNIKKTIEKEMRFVRPELEPHAQGIVKNLGFLILTPALWVYNIDESRLTEKAEMEPQGIRISCLIEKDIMALDTPEERETYLKELGITSPGTELMIQAAYDALDLISFYTIVKNEISAWTIPKGTKAPAAGGKIHSDIERGFIRVEIIKFDDLITAGSEAAAKAQGKTKVQGKEHVIEDGDICHFLFNV